MFASFVRRLAALGAALLVGGVMSNAAFAQASAAAPGAASAPAAAPVAPEKMPTPRDAAGHPILVGVWGGGAPDIARGIGTVTANGVSINTYPARGGSWRGFEEDGGLLLFDDPNKPIYKPEFWDEARENQYWGNWRDPQYYCLPVGVPRLWTPAQIMKVEGEPKYLFRYAGRSQGMNAVRDIWNDGRAFTAAQLAGETWNGSSVGRWEGDTFVVETVGFTNSSWLEKNGYMHGFKMKVTERFTRVGNTLIWQAIVDDPEYFQEPWVWTPKIAYLNATGNTVVNEANPCDSRIQEGWGTEEKPAGSPVRSGTF